MRVAFISLIFCFASQLYAQKSFWGLTSGFTIANRRVVNESANAKATTYLGDLIKPSLGLYFQYSLSAPLAVKITAQYLQLGEKIPSNLIFKYLSFPVVLRYSANPHFSLSAGPYLSFLLNPNDKISPGIVSSGAVLKDSYSKHDFGFYIAAEQDIYKRLALNVSYSGGLKNVSLIENYTSHVTGLATHVKVTNCAFNVSLVYKINKRFSF